MLISLSDPPAPSKGKAKTKSSSTPRPGSTFPKSRSEKNNLQPKQFGKHASGPPSVKGTDYTGTRRSSSYQGKHAKGAHAKDYDFQSDLDASRKPSNYKNKHSSTSARPEGKHGKPYSPEHEIKGKIPSPHGKHRQGMPLPEGKHGKAYNAEADIAKSMHGDKYTGKHSARGRKKARSVQLGKHATLIHQKVHNALQVIRKHEGKNRERLESMHQAELDRHKKAA